MRAKTRRDRARERTAEGWPELVLLIDTETTTDTAQRLRFGSYRLGRWDWDPPGQRSLHLIEEGLFYGDDLPVRAPRDLRALRAYVKTAVADVAPGHSRIVPLYSRREFVDLVLWRAVAQGRALICGFNLPFDLSRLVVSWSDTRPRDRARRMAGGFSFRLWEWWNADTRAWEEHRFRPRLLIRHEDSKRARFAWGTCLGEELSEEPGHPRRRYTGKFLDLKTLAFALSGESHSLASAAKEFGVAQEKGDADYTGPITPEYIAYNRQDLHVSQALLEALRTECDRHPIAVDPWQLRSSASLAKGYLRAAGITPLAGRATGVPAEVHGAAMEAYFGGRTECHVTRHIVPVVYTDVTSMYPTVQSLARLDEWLTAASLRAEPCTEGARRALADITLNRCLTPDLWPTLRFLALVRPADDVLPLRAQYDAANENYSIGVNRVMSEAPHWHTGFDLAASVLLTGRVPHILQAVTLRPDGKADTLRPVQLRSQVTLDPRSGDIFRTMVEMRHRVKRDSSLPAVEQKRLSAVLKVIANSGSYGIFAEMNPQDLPAGTRRPVRIIGGSESFTAHSTKPETAGEYCFPPMAALVTGAARLLLAVMEKLVTDAGGTYACCDTDSMAIIATESGGFVPCPGGNHSGPVGEPGIIALSWAEVRDIINRIDGLKPYGREVQDTLLKIEKENFQGAQQIQLFAFAISAKRYCLFRDGPEGLRMVKALEHGLGHLMNPMDPEDRVKGESGAPVWIEDIWRGFVLAYRGQKPPIPPPWFMRPAVARHGFTSPALLGPIGRAQSDLDYAGQVKPFNFSLTCYVTGYGAPDGADPETCHFIGPFERNPRKWVNQDWYDTASGSVCRISTHATTSRGIAGVKSVADIVREYLAHPESKSLAPDGEPVGPVTRGLLQRRYVSPVHVFHLGKETNRLEEVEQGQIRRLDDVQEIYEHPRHTAWDAVYIPLLRRVSARELAEESGIAESLIHRYRKGTVRPNPRRMKQLMSCLRGRLAESQAVERIRPLRARRRDRLTP